MKKIISVFSIIMLIVFFVSNVYATNNINLNEIYLNDEIYEDEYINENVNNVVDDFVNKNNITKEDLQKAIEKINNDMNAQFRIEGNKIILSSDGEEYNMIYNLDDNPKFISRAVITENMTKDKYDIETENLLLGIFGFIMVGVDKGIETEDLAFYILLTLYTNMDLGESGIIVDNQFNAIKIAERVFNKDIIIEDDLYKLTIKKVSNTQNEYVVEAVYEVKIDGDFSIIEDYDFEDIIPTNEILENTQIARNEFFQEVINQEIAINEAAQWIENMLSENSVLNNIVEIPQTGKTFGNLDLLWIGLFVSVSILVLYIAYNRKIDGNK